MIYQDHGCIGEGFQKLLGFHHVRICQVARCFTGVHSSRCKLISFGIHIYIYTYIIYIYMISENINGSYRTIHDYKIFTYFRSTTGLGGDIFRLRNASRADPHRVTLSLCAAQAQRRIAAIRRWLCQPALTGVPAVDRTDHNCMHLGGP